MVDRTEIYLRNATAMWKALHPGAPLDRHLLRVDLPAGGTRMILREPPSAETLADIGRLSPASTVVLEDVFCGAEAVPITSAARVLRMPVMNRTAGAAAETVSPTVRVTEVGDAETLAEAERVIVDGFPFPHHQPWVRGRALPPRVLALPGWRVWLAFLRGVPAAAAYTFDDGFATGVYWLATLHAHRGRGLARAVMTTAMAARPEHEFTLVATEAGRPLYESLGFAAIATAAWHIRPPLTDRSAP